MHKKIKIISFLLLSFLLFKIEVQASEGAVCTYEINSNTNIVCSLSESSPLSCSVAMVQNSGIDTPVANISINVSKLPSSSFQKDDKWDCPKTLYGTYSSSNGFSVKNLSVNAKSLTSFQLIESKSFYGTEIKKASSGPSESTSNPSTSPGTTGTTKNDGKTSGCDILGGVDSKTVKLLAQLVKIVRLGIPILIIILGIIDFMRILFSGEEKVFRESFTRFVKRLLIGVVIIFLPYILQLLVSLSGIETQYGIDNFFCGIIDATGVKGDKKPSTYQDPAGDYKTSNSCDGAGYIWNSVKNICVTGEGNTISKTDCKKSGYIVVKDNSALKGYICTKGTDTTKKPSYYKSFFACNNAGHVWNSVSKKCMANTEIKQSDCTASGYKLFSNSQGYKCINKMASEHTTKIDCEKFGYRWTYNDDETGYCHT